MEPDDDKTQTHKVLIKGTEISHYRIINKIGAGGMGEVYLAEDTQLDRKVALKFLPPHLCADEDCRARFKREAQAAAKLDHPNIIPVYEVSDFQGRPYFAMAHVEGRSLKEYLSSEDPGIEQIIELTLQICEGLQAAHEQDVTHRDIKPSNILIDSHGRARIVDFGLAAVKGTDQLTKAGSTMGTIGYMSPEQVRGEQVDHRSDLFSLGVILYELTAGRLPFVADTEAGTMNAVLNATPEPLSRYKTGVSGELQHIVSKLLEKDTQHRYQTSAGLISDLKRLVVAGEVSVAPTRRKKSLVKFLIGCVIGVALFAVVDHFLFGDSETAPKRKMIAVLPFENLGDPEDEYFADGITEEITARLARVGDLGVICRLSAMRYKDSDKSLSKIGKELGVDFILTGSVRWQDTGSDTSHVRVTPQLIKVSDQSQVWADIYNEKLTEVFTVQANIATSVVASLDVSLIEDEKRAIESQPTDNMDAYRFYLRGRDYWTRYAYDVKDLDRALNLLEKAVGLDTTFAEAYAALSTVRSWCYWIGYDDNSDMLRLAEEAADKAVEYDSLQAYSHAALGALYYWGYQEYERALEELYQAHEKIPSNAEVMAMAAYVERRLGNWERSLELQKKAHELSPFHSWMLEGIVECSTRMRRWDDAEKYLEKAMHLFPDSPVPYNHKARILLVRDGDFVAAQEALDSAPDDLKNSLSIMQMKMECDDCARDSVGKLETVRAFGTLAKTPSDSTIYLYHLAGLYKKFGWEDSSRTLYEQALRYAGQIQTESRVFSSWLTPSIGVIYMRMGLYDEAVRAGLEDMKRFPLEKEHIWGAWRMEQMAMIYAAVGEYDKAVDLLDTVLSVPSETSVARLRIDPYWDPVRDHPRFEALIEKYEKIHGT